MTSWRLGILCLAGLLPVLAGCGSGSPPPPDPDPPQPPPPTSTDPIHVNQVGFHPDGTKIAVIIDASATIGELIDAGDNVVFSDNLPGAVYWNAADQSVRAFDFSSFTTPGTYRVRSNTGSVSPEFMLGASVHEDLGRVVLKSFYFTRSATALTAQYAGQWQRAAGHPDTSVLIHASAAGPVRMEGMIISSPGGWYDAGDYNKYIVNASYATYMMLAPYDACPTCFADGDIEIPESGNGQADLLDEARFNLDWMLTMQDPDDGGVYHKLTRLSFSGWIMPAEDGADRYVVQKSTEATLTFAAVAAFAARVYAATDPAYSNTLATAARSAWDWALLNPQTNYLQPADVSTGTYAVGGDDLVDEWNWARVELYLLTGDGAFVAGWSAASAGGGVPWWGYVNPLAWLSVVREATAPPDLRTAAENHILAAADNLVATADNGYRVSMDGNDFNWGSNGNVATMAVLLAHAHELTGDTAYLDTAVSGVDYIFGRNPVGISYVTGTGTASPMFIHHRPSGADGIEEPVPGLVAGGPNPAQQDAGNCSEPYPSNLPALSYFDHECSYASNEIAINWSGSLLAALFMVHQQLDGTPP